MQGEDSAVLVSAHFGSSPDYRKQEETYHAISVLTNSIEARHFSHHQHPPATRKYPKTNQPTNQPPKKQKQPKNPQKTTKQQHQQNPKKS